MNASAKMPHKRYVLDSFALLCLLEDQSGAEHVGQIIADPTVAKYMSVVNLGEVLYILERCRSKDAGLELLQAVTEGEEITLIDAGLDQAVGAAAIKAGGGISYADSFAVALAKELDAPVLTGDPEFSAVEKEVRIEWVAT